MPSLRKLGEVVAQGLMAGAIGYFVLWACAPPTAMPPPMPSAEGHTWSGGVAAIGGVTGFQEPALGAHLWGHRRLGERVDLGLTAFGGYPYMFGGGAYTRVGFVMKPNLYVGGQVSAGYLYAYGSVPISYGITDRIWVYTNPAVGVSFIGLAHIPVGVSAGLTEHLNLNVEAGMHGDFQALVELGYFGLVTDAYGAVGLSWHK
ncbi:MAG: hypothetical protein H6739_14455 [Alphaproteobacteria bacterium]|nr:hypothetical protein [Alphaproteobacteria bacterium]